MRSTASILIALMLLGAAATSADAHGGSYRRPPTIRTPIPGGGLPTPTPPPRGGTPTPTPHPGIPNPNPGAAPGGLNRPPPAPPKDTLRWQLYWTYNRDRYLQVRRTLENRRTTTEGEQVDWRAGAIRALIEALDQKHVDISTGAAIALGKAGDRRAVDPLIEKLSDHRADRTLRESAALALGMIGADEAREPLTATMLDRTEPQRLRAFAAYGLGLLRSPACVPALASALRNARTPTEVRAAVLVAMGAVGDEILLPMLVDALKGKIRGLGAYERASAADGLGRLGDPAAVDVLLKAISSRDTFLRQGATLALGRLELPPDDNRVFNALRFLATREQNRSIRALATVALGRTGRPEASVVLLDLSDRAKYVSQKGFALLGLGMALRDTRDEGARERVASNLRSKLARGKFSVELRGAAAIALGIMRDRKAVPVLSKIVSGKGDPAARGYAALALGMIGDREAIPALQSALSAKGDPRLLREVALALGMLGDSDSMRTLVDLVRSGRSEWVRANAALGVARIGGPLAAQAMTELLQEKSASGPMRGLAAVALGHLLDERTVPALSRIVEDMNFLLPFEAIQELLTIQ